MRLVSFEIEGFRRFEKAKVDLDSPVVALIGPNEAGKTTLLNALAHLETLEPLEIGDVTRALKKVQRPKDIVFRARYILEGAEHAAIKELGGTGSPRWYSVLKRRDGTKAFRLEPDLNRNLSARGALAELLRRTGRNTRLAKYLGQRPGAGHDDDDSYVSLLSMVRAVRKVVLSGEETLPKEGIQLMIDLSEALGEADPLAANTNVLERLRSSVAETLEVERTGPPRESAWELLEERRPKIRKFSDADRTLQHEYNAAALKNPPAALQNLFQMAGVRSRDVLTAITSEQHHDRLGIQNRANDRLKQRFQEAWNQSSIYPVLHFDEQTVRVHVPSRDTLAPIAERSDGLRMFVALAAFTDQYRSLTPPILLVDEAERHLHYDAQADLVRVFENQSVASQIIYSTHSAGCLPSDLGVGIRAVQPVEDGEFDDEARSTISGSFWSEGPGFSPLLFAMGANVLAFAPARIAVLTEGKSDPIILPTLFREVSGRSRLGFQVAPGIANVPGEAVADLDLEAPRMAYLLDGDPGGKANRTKLVSGGVPKDLVLTFPYGRVLEDYVEPGVYLAAVNEELRRSYGDGYELDIRLPSKNRPDAVEKACTKMGVSGPNKVRVASRIIERRADGPLVDPQRQEELKAILEQLDGVLRISSSPSVS